jgi:hypothetical protein
VSACYREVVRRAVLAGTLAVVGCYRSANETCAIVVCDPDAGVIDASGDAATDGAPATCTMPTSGGSEAPLANVVAQWFVGAFAADFPSVQFAPGSGSVAFQLGADFLPPYTEVISADAMTKYDAPRLAPNGLEIFLRVDETTGSRLGIVTRAAGATSWPGVVTPVTLLDSTATKTLVIGTDAVPSPPTVTNPRLMVVSHGAGIAIDEFEEIAPGSWKLLRQHPVPAGVSYSGEASITGDGTFLVFRGRVGSLNQAMYVARQSDDFFGGTAAALPGTTDSVNEPYLAPDCKHLFYNNQTGPQVYMVTYP